MSFRSSFRPLLRKLLRPLIDPAQRVFITLNGTDAFYTLSAPWAVGLNTDFTIEFDVTTSYSGVGLVKILDGEAGNNAERFAVSYVGSTQTIQQNAYWETEVDGVATNILPNDNILHRVKLFRDSGTADQSARNIEIIGRRFTDEEHFPATISRLEFRTAGDNRTYELNRLLGNSESDTEGNTIVTYVNIPTGAPDRELFTKNTSTDPDQWENADKSRIIQIA